jgi:trimeric autotransporter adhesin
LLRVCPRCRFWLSSVRFLVLILTLGVVACGGLQQAWAVSPAATTTTLAVTSAGGAVTTVAFGSVVVLTATVNAGSTAVTTGQVNFCDANATYCTDVHILGTAHLTSGGTATIRFIPGIGSHQYKAVFAGTSGYVAGSSSVSALTVTGLYPTNTSISSSGNPGNYTLTATVSTAGSLSPSETVSFLDTTNANHSLGTAELGAQTAGLSFVNSSKPATGSSPRGAAVGDFNNDGIPDLAIPNGTFSAPITILLGKGDGTFTSSSLSTGTSDAFCRIVGGDFNGDGNQDLAAQDCGGVYNDVLVFLGHGDGTFTAVPPGTSVGFDPAWTAVGDFNGDGKLDLAVVTSFSPYMTTLLGNGDGTFTPAAASSALPYLPMQVAVGDFNGDGKTDLVVSCQTDGSLTILLGNGDGTFTPATTSPVTGIDPNAVTVGDFNGDGKLDLAVTTGGVSGNDALRVLLGNGDSTFTAAASDLSVGVEPQTIAIGDFNGDAKADLAVANFGSDTLSVLLGNGDGTFAPATTSPATGPSPYSAVVADFNGDGKADLAAVNNAGNDVTVLLSQPTETSTASLSGVSPLGTGTHLVDASYPGDSNNDASISSTIALTAQQGKPTVQVTPSSTNISTLQPLSVTVVVSDGAANPAPSGTVTLTSGNYSSSATSLSNGSATINVPAGSLAAGTDALTANYSGDSNYVPNSGSASVTVTAPTFTLSGTAVTLNSGATTGNTSTITVTPVSGFTGSVVLTAAVTASPTGAQYPPSLSFGSTSPVNITGPNPGTATLTVSTSAATSASLANPKRPGVPWYATGGATLACVLLLGIPTPRRSLRTILGMLVILILTSSILGCGGGGGKGSPSSTPGAYTITVTGTSGSTTATTTITLTVQ